MKNKSKSCFNFIRRELSESEKLLLNKYNEIEPEQNEIKLSLSSGAIRLQVTLCGCAVIAN